MTESRNLKTPNLAVDIGKLVIKNPIMPASGAFGLELAEFIDLNQLGALVPKSITKEFRAGNKTPRICEISGGMINSIGIQSIGLDRFIKETIPAHAKFTSPLIVSISAESIDEFAEMSEILGKHPDVAALELNISCPNLKSDGEAFGMNAEVSYELVKLSRNVTDKPLITKLSPNVTHIQEIALACEEGGTDSLTVANTLLGMAIDITTRKPKIDNIMGGMSGPVIKPLIVRMIYQVSQATSLPIIGCGGVMNAEDVIEMMLAGASAVQVGTVNFLNPYAMIEIIQGIKDYLNEYNIDDVNKIIGKVEIPYHGKVYSNDYL